MTTEEILESYSKFVIGNYPRQPVVIVRGEGSYIWDRDGRRYLDLFPGWGCSAIGHCHPKVVQALCDQVRRLIHIDNTFYTAEQARLAQMLSERSFGGQCFFCNSGAEAIEAAIKLTRRYTPRGRYKIISMEKSFHGRTSGAMAATGQQKAHEGNDPLLPGFAYVPYNDVDAVTTAIDDETAGVLVEPIQGEGGVIVPDDDYLGKLREVCDGRNVVLICDEVQTGCGRTGAWFAYQDSDIEPDIMTLAKSLGGGAPIGATLARPEVAGALTPGSHASTYGGNPLVLSAAIAMIEAVEEENLLANTQAMGEYAMTKAAQLQQEFDFVEAVRGRGLMIAIELAIPGRNIMIAAMRNGLRVNCTQETVIRMLPAMNVTAEQLDEGFEILRGVFGEARTAAAGTDASQPTSLRVGGTER